jgi:protease-4
MLASLTGAEQDQQAMAPRGWFGIAAMNRQLTEQRLAQDLTLLTRTGSVQASCLDCRAFLPAVPRAAEAKGWLAALALLLK